jgi:hypothetical protein
MNKPLVEKTWEVPGYDGSGPVTISVRIADVRITDSEGRFVVVGPFQTADVGAELTEVGDWIGESFTWPERA